MLQIAEVIDWGALLKVVYTAVLGGIGLCAIFAVATFGASRSLEHRQNGDTAAAWGFAVLMAVAFAVVAVAVVLGIIVMTSK